MEQPSKKYVLAIYDSVDGSVPARPLPHEYSESELPVMRRIIGNFYKDSTTTASLGIFDKTTVGAGA